MSTTTDTIQGLLPATVDELVEATGKSKTTVRKALKELDAVKNDDGKFEVPEVKPRANHGYARNTGSKRDADQRDADVIGVIKASEDGVKLADIADALSITKRAARHAVWRLGNAGTVEQPSKGVYALAEAS
jgi:predicted transcriptional regulator